MKKKIRTYSDGEPLSANLNRIIDAIEKTPMRDFHMANSNVNLNEMSEREIMEYLDKNPLSLFVYAKEYGGFSSIFTNFVCDKTTNTIYYDILRIGEPNILENNTYLTTVKEVDKHSGLGVGRIDGNYWGHIDFLIKPFRLLNWGDIPWEDLK